VSYTIGMKTAISLSQEVFAQADRLARRLHKSRSALYREAVAEFIARHEPDAITEAMDRVADEIETRPDSFSSAAATQVLERVEW
jgi:antitoxin MazE6